VSIVALRASYCVISLQVQCVNRYVCRGIHNYMCLDSTRLILKCLFLNKKTWNIIKYPWNASNMSSHFTQLKCGLHTIHWLYRSNRYWAEASINTPYKSVFTPAATMRPSWGYYIVDNIVYIILQACVKVLLCTNIIR